MCPLLGGKCITEMDIMNGLYFYYSGEKELVRIWMGEQTVNIETVIETNTFRRLTN